MDIVLSDIEVRLAPDDRRLFLLPKLEVHSGRKVLITGESGKGKTTLLHLLAGLFTPASGQVRVGEFRLHEMNDEERCAFRRKNVAMVFQKLNLIEHLTALENVMLAQHKGTRAERIERAQGALNDVKLADMAQRRSSLLSLGEQQRVVVARVLVSESSVILADEPTSSLDGKNAERVMDLLFQAANKKTIIVVSHDQRLTTRFEQSLAFESLVRR